MTTSTTRRLHPTGPARSGPTPRLRSNMSPCRPGFCGLADRWGTRGSNQAEAVPPVDESHRMMLSALELRRSAGTATDGPAARTSDPGSSPDVVSGGCGSCRLGSTGWVESLRIDFGREPARGGILHQLRGSRSRVRWSFLS